MIRQVVEGGQRGRFGGDDEPALQLELEVATRHSLDVRGQLPPPPEREQGQIELRPRQLVGYQEVPLARSRGAPGDRSAVDDRDPLTATDQGQGAGGPDHAGADDDHVRRHPVQHGQ